MVLAVVPLLESRPELAGLLGMRIGAGFWLDHGLRFVAGTKSRNIGAAKVYFV